MVTHCLLPLLTDNHCEKEDKFMTRRGTEIVKAIIPYWTRLVTAFTLSELLDNFLFCV
jgi:hypothetical protein